VCVEKINVGKVVPHQVVCERESAREREREGVCVCR